VNDKVTSIDASVDEQSILDGWTEFFEESLDNRNLSLKDVETIKYAYLRGAKKSLEIAESSKNRLKEELSSALGEDEEDSEMLWTPVTGDSNAEAGSQQG
jgi:hypothetical protein